MRYLTVRHFHYPCGKIPLFIELRRLNGLSAIDLLSFIRATSLEKGSAVTQTQFELFLKGGGFLLVLDGFDELDLKIRDEVQRQLLEFEKNFPEATIVVSSRPDDRFGSWTSYHVYKVVPFDKPRTVKLVESLPCDAGVKRRFIKEVNGKLYETHKSFLSTPLLASIMLLTYEQFAEIPSKMHEFYSRAFDTLLQKREAQKEQFQRKTHTSLTRDDFKACFAAFCALSYLNGKFQFSDDALKDAAKAAISYSKQASTSFPREIEPDSLIHDLFQSVCMLQRDGIETTFVHRSFQEYFAALFAVGLHASKVGTFLDRCALRMNDSVIPLALDMSRETVEKEWVLKTIHRLEGLLEENGRSLSEVLSRFFRHVTVFRGREGHVWISTADLVEENIAPLESITGLYHSRFRNHWLLSCFEKSADELMQNIGGVPTTSSRLDEFIDFLTAPVPEERRYLHFEINFDGSLEWLVEAVDFRGDIEKIRRNFNAIRRDIEGRDRRRTDILEDFL